MKVLMISTDVNAFHGGSAVQERFKLLANQLELLEVIVFTKKANQFNPQDLGKLKLIPTNSFSPFNYVFDALKIGRTLTRPDLITTQDPFLAGWVGIRLKSYFKTRLELQVHTDLLAENFQKFNWRNRFYVFLAQKFLPQADVVRVVSERIKVSLIKSKLVLESKIYVLPIFVQVPQAGLDDQPRWSSLVQPGDQIVLMVSRLTKEKQINLAIEALAQIEDQRVKLVIIGTGPEQSKLAKQALQLKLSTRVIFAGQLGAVELAQSYKLAQVLLLTSAFEGYGLVLAEAALAGLPIVSTDVGVAKEVGAVIIPAEVSAIVSALNQQLHQPTKPHLPPVSTSESYLAESIKQWSSAHN